MTITFVIPSMLRSYSDGAATVEASGDAPDVRAALSLLFAKCPALRDRIVDERGNVRQHVNVFVGDENIRHTGALATKLAGDKLAITLMPAVSGG